MWYLLYNIIRAGNKFEKLGKKIGIFFDELCELKHLTLTFPQKNNAYICIGMVEIHNPRYILAYRLL